ncbi:MAG TPA: type II secretion system protein [Chthoniobacterales bacterium]|nr:type II secretion system protein [Chthoniobacterales bacterium]
MIRYIVTSADRIYASTTPVRPGLQCFNVLAQRSRSSFRGQGAITIIEMLVVIMVIFILAALVLAASSYVQNRGARARAETEIAAMSAALESYKADNGIYPRSADTDALAANSDPAGGNPANFVTAARYLYSQLTGDSDGNPTTSSASDTKNYFGAALKPSMLSPNPAGANTCIRDPFGYAYGYSTYEVVNPGNANGNNPTFDLWSTCGQTGKKTGETFQQYQQRWIKNW